MNKYKDLPLIIKHEEFGGAEHHKTLYSIGYGATAIENLNLEQLRQIRITLDQFLQKEKV